ncbi:MAG: serine hydrolase [Tissierellia bacterium]|nr:serine hydrolase [Tissierellia bacterium]
MEGIQKVFDPLLKIQGKVSVVYKNLITKESFFYNEDFPMQAASVIKLFVLGEGFRQIEKGFLDTEERFVLKDKDRVPPSGVLTFLHDGLEVTTMDLLILMIILSDNVATNLLIDRLGIENINRFIHELGFSTSILRRKMFDYESAKQGNVNTITAKEVGLFLEKLFLGTVISKEMDQKMIDILKSQQVINKFPLLLEEGEVEIAHKTGEDDGVSHDVGIFYTKKPFLLVVCGNELEDVGINVVMGEVVKELVEYHN